MIFNRYEDILKLNLKIDTAKAIAECDGENKNLVWRQAKTREFLDLIGDQKQDYKQLSGKGFNQNSDRMPVITEFVKQFGSPHKARLQRMNTGSFFEPHRDHFYGDARFRIFCALNNTDMSEYVFFHDGKIHQFEAGTAYVINTNKVHGSMSFVDNTIHLLMSVNVTQESTEFVLKNMSFS